MNKKVRLFLIDLARHRTNQTITYQRLSDSCSLKLDMSIPNDRVKIGDILDAISRFEFENKRPLLSSLVIRLGDDREGDGFYKLGDSLGFGSWAKLKKDGIFEVEQMNKCINYWNDENHYHTYQNV